MEIEIKFIGRDGVTDRERQSFEVETQVRRGDMMNVQKVDNVMENDTVRFRVKGGDRLVLKMPDGDEEIVYDPAQGAAVRKGALDTPETTAERERLERHAAEQQTIRDNHAQAEKERVRMEADKKAKEDEASKALAAGKTVPTGQTNPTTVAAQQQTAPRPAGEKPPLPGSQVGSPPAGNEGKK